MMHTIRVKNAGMFLKAKSKLRGLAEKLKKDCSAMGTVEVIIIIAVLVSLALIFRNFIMELADKIFGKIQSKTNDAIDTL